MFDKNDFLKSSELQDRAANVQEELPRNVSSPANQQARRKTDDEICTDIDQFNQRKSNLRELQNNKREGEGLVTKALTARSIVFNASKWLNSDRHL